MKIRAFVVTVVSVVSLAVVNGCASEPEPEPSAKSEEGLRRVCDVDCADETFHCDRYEGNTCETYEASCGCFVVASTQCPSWSPYLHCNYYGTCYCSTY